jgi:uncharacterized membrane protein YfcA
MRSTAEGGTGPSDLVEHPADGLTSLADSLWALSPWSLLIVLIVILCGGVVRGFGGFGASMLWVTGMSLVLSPRVVIPTALMLEVLASLQLLPHVWSHVHWRSVRWLTVGSAIGLPFGTWVLIRADEQAVRTTIAVLVLLSVASMATNFEMQGIPGARLVTGVGVVSGSLTGAVAMGGPPVILMYFSSREQVVVARASCIMFFLLLDVLATSSAAIGGLVTVPMLWQVFLLLPVALAGVAAGSYLYRRAKQGDIRRFVLWLLAALSLTVLAQTLWP